MKKKFLRIALCVALSVVLLAGCGETDGGGEVTQSSDTLTVEGSDAAEIANEDAEQAYMSFLRGQAKVTTSEKFREDDDDINADDLIYGEYTYGEMKASIEESELTETTAKYTLLDFGQDGVKELVLRFESTNPVFMNWTGIIRYNGEGLDLNYYYTDGYRSYSQLYTSGYLELGGSYSAGGRGHTIVGFDGLGFGKELFSDNDYYGSFAESIAYNPLLGSNGTKGDYSVMSESISLHIREYASEDAVKIAVIEWSDDAEVRANEEEFVAELVELGAQKVSETEIEALCSRVQYKAPEVSWTEWENVGEPSTAATEPNEGDLYATLSVDYASDELLGQPDSYYEFIADNSEYRVNAVFTASATVSDVRVLSLSIDDVDDSGEISYTTEELYSLDKLTPEKPLVVAMAFAGDIPNMGISFTDGNGIRRVYAIAMSGMDGSLLLSEINAAQ